MKPGQQIRCQKIPRGPKWPRGKQPMKTNSKILCPLPICCFRGAIHFLSSLHIALLAFSQFLPFDNSPSRFNPNRADRPSRSTFVVKTAQANTGQLTSFEAPANHTERDSGEC
eukprot:EG_transcript_26897